MYHRLLYVKPQESCVSCTKHIGHTAYYFRTHVSFIKGLLFLQFFRNDWHGAVLSTYVCTDVHSYAMCFSYWFARKDRSDEGACERVTGTYSVGNIYLRSFYITHGSLGEDIATVDTTCKDEHVEIILAEDEPAFILDVKTRIAEHATDYY